MAGTVTAVCRRGRVGESRSGHGQRERARERDACKLAPHTLTSFPPQRRSEEIFLGGIGISLLKNISLNALSE